MTLYKKDGTVYKLQAPNPIMNNQTLWDGFKTHNMEWQTEIDETKHENKLIPPDFGIKETFLSELDKAQIDVVVENKIDTMVENKIDVMVEEPFRQTVVHADLQREKENNEGNGIEKVFIHCLPAKIREKKDDLYGEVYKTIQYETPTSFEGVILNQTDLGIEIWTDANQITKGSIIYPKLGAKRWWKVHSKTEKAGGWTLIGVPSSFQPSFDL